MCLFLSFNVSTYMFQNVSFVDRQRDIIVQHCDIHDEVSCLTHFTMECLIKRNCLFGCSDYSYLQNSHIWSKQSYLIAPMALAHPLHPIDNRSRNKRRNLWVGRCVSSWWPWIPSKSSVLIYMYIHICVYVHSLYEFCYRTFGICFKQHFDTRYLVFYNTSPPRMFLSLDLLWEYRIQHIANGPLYVTSSYSTWIFCRGVSGFATDCPCGVWCRGLTTCLLHVGPPFGNRILNNSWTVGLT